MAPKYQTALIGTSDGAIRLSHDAPVPEVVGDHVLIKTKAVSVNPVDTKMTGSYVTADAIAGFDLAGTVEDIGPEATKCGIMLGDRVCTVVLGMNSNEPTIGAFAEWTTAAEWTLLKIPNSLSFEEGASLGISFMTTGLAIFKSLGVPGTPLKPSPQRLPVLVFGGSSSTGTAAIQLLKLAGFDPVATCSPHNFDLVRTYGATAVFDYKDQGVVPAIKAYTKNGLRFALDCISTTASMQFCYQVIGRAGGNYTALEPYAEAVAQKRKVVRPDWVMGPQMMGKEIGWPKPHWRPADAEIGRFGAEWTVTLQKLLDKGLIRPHPILVRQGGLPDVLGGIEDIREKRISGQKLVFTV